jgi:hypothetical protein
MPTAAFTVRTGCTISAKVAVTNTFEDIGGIRDSLTTLCRVLVDNGRGVF